MKRPHKPNSPPRVDQAQVDVLPFQHVQVRARNGTLSVLDANGRPIPGITAVDIALRPAKPPLMRLNMVAGNFEVEGVPMFGVTDPRDGRLRPVKRIEFADGDDAFEPPAIEAAAPATPSTPPQPDAPAEK